MSLDDTIANALAGYPPGHVLSFDSLRPAARAAQLRPEQLHGQIRSAITEGYIEPLRAIIDGIEYDCTRPTEHLEGNHRLIRHYRRTAKRVEGQPEPVMAGQVDLFELVGGSP